jgi:capsule polysaccharide export protein KpsE/RkpR
LVKEAQVLDTKRELDAKMDKKIIELDAKIDKKNSDLDIKTDLSINGVFDVVNNDLQPKIAGLQTDKESMQKQLQDALVKVDAVSKQTAECRNIADKNVLDLEVQTILHHLTFPFPPFLQKILLSALSRIQIPWSTRPEACLTTRNH